MNIRFEYMYRDGGNYKQFGQVVFTNSSGLSIEDIDAQIKACLIEKTWFNADKWEIKDLHLYKWDDELDHDWHEYVGVENTNEDGIIDIIDFLFKINPLNLSIIDK